MCSKEPTSRGGSFSGNTPSIQGKCSVRVFRVFRRSTCIQLGQEMNTFRKLTRIISTRKKKTLTRNEKERSVQSCSEMTLVSKWIVKFPPLVIVVVVLK